MSKSFFAVLVSCLSVVISVSALLNAKPQIPAEIPSIRVELGEVLRGHSWKERLGVVARTPLINNAGEIIHWTTDGGNWGGGWSEDSPKLKLSKELSHQPIQWGEWTVTGGFYTWDEKNYSWKK